MIIKNSKKTKSTVSAKSYLESRFGALSLGALMEAIRQGEELSQVEFAAQLGISKSHLCDIEKLRKSVSPAKAASYAKILGYSEAQFVRLALQDLVTRNGLAYRVGLEAS